MVNNGVIDNLCLKYQGEELSDMFFDEFFRISHRIRKWIDRHPSAAKLFVEGTASIANYYRDRVYYKKKYGIEFQKYEYKEVKKIYGGGKWFQ